MSVDQPSTSNYHLFSDYHTHPQGHRVQLYTPALLQPWADSARKFGLTDIAFTDHDRYHAGIDFDEIDRLREKNPDLRIRAGIELDNDPIHSAAGQKWIEKHWDKLDFVLGSVHFLDRDDQMFDSVPDGAEQFEGHNVEALYADYLCRVREMAAAGLIDCLAHLDLIRARNLAVELSTAGWRKPVNELYPGDRIIELAIEKQIPFTIASDAHSHAQLGDSYPRLAQKMAAFGIRQICTFENHQRVMRAVCAEPLL